MRNFLSKSNFKEMSRKDLQQITLKKSISDNSKRQNSSKIFETAEEIGLKTVYSEEDIK